MTPQQLAEQVDLDHGIFTREERDQVRKEIADVICSAVEEAKAEEREACAKLAEDAEHYSQGVIFQYIANTIRLRGVKK